MNAKDEKFVIAALRNLEIKTRMIDTELQHQRSDINKIKEIMLKIADILEDSL